MPTLEEIVSRVHDLLSAAAAGNFSVEKNSTIPEEMKNGEQLIIVLDGEPGEPETFLGGFRTALYSHVVDIEVYAADGDSAERDILFGQLCKLVGSTLEDNRSLGGLVQGMEYGPPAPIVTSIEGSPDIKKGVIALRVEYATNTPIG